jgi:hypothetical protein
MKNLQSSVGERPFLNFSIVQYTIRDEPRTDSLTVCLLAFFYLGARLVGFFCRLGPVLSGPSSHCEAALPPFRCVWWARRR